MPLFVTVWTPDVSVVTAAPSIQYLVLARLGNGAVPMFMVCCAMYYLALEYLASFWQFRCSGHGLTYLGVTVIHSYSIAAGVVDAKREHIGIGHSRGGI